MTNLITRLNAEDLFDQLGGEEEQQLREIELKDTKLHERLEWHIHAYNYFSQLNFDKMRQDDVMIDEAGKLMELGPPLSIGREITLLSFLLTKQGHADMRYGNRVGEYVAACMRKCNDSEIVIHTGECRARLLGYGNKGRKIMIEGNAGMHTGTGMESGLIVVRGDINGACFGGLNGGELIVEGNSQNCEYLGHFIRGGVIRIKGSIRNSKIGPVIGGSIYLEGDDIGDCLSSWDKGDQGQVYHKGTLIWQGGKPVT